MKLQTCHLVVWTDQSLHIFVIPFNKAAWDSNFERLRKYYFGTFVLRVVARENGQLIDGTTRMKCAAQQAPLQGLHAASTCTTSYGDRDSWRNETGPRRCRRYNGNDVRSTSSIITWLYAASTCAASYGDRYSWRKKVTRPRRCRR